MVSDGMSSGTLNMVNIYLERIQGKTGNWMQLYADRKVSRRLMDIASTTAFKKLTRFASYTTNTK